VNVFRSWVKRINRWVGCVVCGLTIAFASSAQTMHAPDITKTPTLYVVPYAHLDTQWRWEMPQSISEYMLKTMRVNFDLIDRYPHYVFNWTGSNRYRLMKEYFPADYTRMAGYIQQGRWFPAGSSVEEGDVNLPGAEGIFRQILYGNTYFRHEFGKASNEYMLPDCFGFPASLPSILAEAGIKGFSTQKLNATWQPAPRVGGPDSPEKTPEGIPFNVGLWIGPDGKHVIAALNPGTYNGNTYVDLSRANPWSAVPQPQAEQQGGGTEERGAGLRRFYANPEQDWVKRIALDGKVTGVFADYHYVGTGDIGGATQESTVRLLEAIVTKQPTVLPFPNAVRKLMPDSGPAQVGEGPVHVIESTAAQIFADISPEMTQRMPTVSGDLELIGHSAGSLTSQAYHKRWVIMNEALADNAEKSSVAAAWLGGPAYPQKRLNDAWTLALAGHFHDLAAGTATPAAYQYAWNDDVIAGNQFASVFANATEAVASAMDTSGKGTPIVIFNSLNTPREDVVEVTSDLKGQLVAVGGGTRTPAQRVGDKLVFVAKAPSVGYAVYHLVPGQVARNSDVHASGSVLENKHYRVELNADGDVSSIYSKDLKKEMLEGPVRLALSNDTPKQWPAWNMDFDQEQAAPLRYVKGPAKIEVIENGPVRASIRVSRKDGDSTFVQIISLAAGGAGRIVTFGNAIDWHEKAVNLKATFQLTASNPEATYNEDVGAIKRPTAFDRQFEVMTHRWIDLTDTSSTFGATILTGVKNGSDKRSDNTIRVTLLRTPGISTGGGRGDQYTDQASQDWGHHEFTYGFAAHAQGWREAQTDWLGQGLNEPLRPFQTEAHDGPLGKTFSLLTVSNPRIRLLAMKKAEDSDDLIVRMVELDGKPESAVHISFPSSVVFAKEVDAQERLRGDAQIADGALVANFGPYEPKTFAVKLASPPSTIAKPLSVSLPLPFDTVASSKDGTTPTDGGFDGNGNTYPAEMMGPLLSYNGASFDLQQAEDGSASGLTANGQVIQVPRGDFDRVYVLAASRNGDRTAEFQVGGKKVLVTVQAWNGYIGQWDTRLWKKQDHRDWSISSTPGPFPPPDFKSREAWPTTPSYPADYVGLRDGFIKSASIAWYASHHHTAAGLNAPYQYSYLFAYELDLPGGARELRLPKDQDVVIFGIVASRGYPKITPSAPLFDTLAHKPDAVF
jgi:alpha-mannosidase